MPVYKVIEVIGTSDVSWEDAASQAVQYGSTESGGKSFGPE